MTTYRRSLVKILAEHGDKPNDPDDRELIEKIASALYERAEDAPDIDKWPQSVRHFYACYDLMYQVGNGGFAQAAFNVPELLPFAKEAYSKLNRPKAAKLCDDAIAMLPREVQLYLAKELTDCPSLEDVFEHFDESPMAALDENIPDEFWVDFELQKMARQNRAEFESMEAPS